MVTNTKRHTEISVTDDSTNITVYTSTVDDLYIGTFSRGIQAYVWKGALYALDIYDRTLNSDELQIALQNIEK